jgi:hypothetical protein
VLFDGAMGTQLMALELSAAISVESGTSDAMRRWC